MHEADIRLKPFVVSTELNHRLSRVYSVADLQSRRVINHGHLPPARHCKRLTAYLVPWRTRRDISYQLSLSVKQVHLYTVPEPFYVTRVMKPVFRTRCGNS
jgi:hypothetical protein